MTISDTHPSTTSASPTAARRRRAAVVLGAVLALAGLTAPAPPATATTDHWRTVQPMHVARGFHSATLLRNGRVLVAGGVGATGQPTASAEVFNPATGSWRRVAPMAHARAYHRAVLLRSGAVLVLGGGEPPEVYEPWTGRWHAARPSPRGNGATTATRMDDGRVFVYGTSDECDGIPEIYTPWKNSWRDGAAIGGSVLPCGGKSVLLHDGRVLMHGGENNQGAGFTGSYLYDPVADTWSEPTSDDGLERYLHMDQSLTVLTTGQVLLAGGSCRLCTGSERFTMLFDPTIDNWSRTGDFVVGREGNALAALAGGRALAAGGYAIDWTEPDPQPQPRSAEVYDVHTGAWTRTDDMHDDHGPGLTGTTLPDGRVLVVGGADQNRPSATGFAEVFVP